MKENEILNNVLAEFLNITENKNNAEEAIISYDEFYEFVENNDQLKEYMYEFFYKLLDDYVSFKFYHRPIPALADDEAYMKKYKQETLNQGRTFFNFGGIRGAE